MIIELKQKDIVVLLKAIRDKRLDTDDLDDLRGYKPDEFKGFSFLPWTDGLRNSAATSNKALGYE